MMMPAAPACTARTATCRSLAYEVSARQPEHVGCLRGGEFGVDWDEVNRCSGGEVFEQPTHRSIHSWRKIADNRSQFGVPRIERRNGTAFVVVRIEVLGSERGHATITLDNRHKRNLPAWKPAPASAQPQAGVGQSTRLSTRSITRPAATSMSYPSGQAPTSGSRSSRNHASRVFARRFSIASVPVNLSGLYGPKLAKMSSAGTPSRVNTSQRSKRSRPFER